MTNPIHIALAFDEKYVTPFLVVLTSIFENNKGIRIHLHSIATGVSFEEKQRIRAFVQKNNSEISFYQLKPTALQGLIVPAKKPHMTLAAYYRLFFPFLVPGYVKKLLYLDSDIIVLKNLHELYQQDLGLFPFGAVPEVNATKSRPDLGIHEEGIYFNSGVMLINVPEWKKQKITEKAVRFVREFPDKLVCLDQDALNATIENNYFKLPANFNVLPFDIPDRLSKNDYRKFLEDKVIMHYTLPQTKPWKALTTHPFKYLYKNYFYKSPQAKEKLYTDVQLTADFAWKLAKMRLKTVKRRLSPIFMLH